MRLMRKLEEPLKTKYLHYEYMRIADYDISRGNYGRITDAEIYNKLGQLEEAEELCEKIVSQPIYEKYDTGEIHREDYTEYHALYNFKERRIEVYGFEFINWFELDEYGKTWALTREELN